MTSVGFSLVRWMALMLILPTVAGCVDNVDPPVALLEGPLVPHAFFATFHDGERVRNLELDGPHTILLPNGTWAPAYRLHLSHGPDWYLDADWMHIATADPCHDCPGKKRWSYPPPALSAHGIGIDLGHRTPTLEGQAAQLWIDRRDDFVFVDGDRWIAPYDLPATWIFTPGRMVPDGPGQQVLQYHPGEPLASITTRWEQPKRQPTLDHDGLFPGDDADIFGTGFTPRLFWDGVQRDPQQRAFLLGGCWMSFLQTDEVISGTVPKAQAWFTLFDGDATWRSLTVNATGTTTTVYEFDWIDRDGAAGCSRFRSSFPMDALHTLAVTARPDIHCLSVSGSFFHFGAPRSTYGGRAVSDCFWPTVALDGSRGIITRYDG